jgi:hypothetical protein
MGGAVKSVTKAVSSAVKSVTKVVQKVAANVGKAVTNVIKNPLPIIETVALTYLGLPPNLASAAVTAANGGSVKDVGTAYLAATAGQYAGKAVGAEVASAVDSKVAGQIASSATGASTQTTLTALAKGQSLSDALSAGAKAFAVGGITSGTIEGLKAGFQTDVTPSAPIEERSVDAATGQPVVDPSLGPTPNALGVNPEYAQQQLAPGVPLPTESAIGPTESKLLSSALYPAVYSTLFGKQQQAPVSAPRGTTTTQTTQQQQPVSPIQTQASVGSQALSQALRIGDAGAPIFGGDKEEGKKAGWNVESLRYMGNSEA